MVAVMVRLEQATHGDSSGRLSSTVVPIDRARELRARGWGYNRIAAALGVSATTARRWLKPGYAERDRELLALRRASYRGTCRVCGRSTNGSEGPGKASDLCSHCFSRETQLIWSPDRIIAAFREFFVLHGRPPFCSEWTPSLATSHRKEADAETWASGHWPTVAVVQREFGSWSAGMRAAGFMARRIGNKDRGFMVPTGLPVKTAQHLEILAQYETGGWTHRSLADHRGVCRSTITRSLRIARQAREGAGSGRGGPT